MKSEEIWRRKTDEELLQASLRLDEYTDEGQDVILAEIERRKSPEYLLAQEESRTPPQKEEQIRRVPIRRATIRNQKSWLAQRVLLALGLMIGFYVFALLIALTLLWIPYAEWTYAQRIDIRILVSCVGGGLAILWALVPRADRFEPPGPRLSNSDHPKLFELIREIAHATGQAEPTDVYLLNDVNAWVTHRGGTMGFGSHRVMGIGLPLLQALSVSELKAVIAHEFGHYSAGDVKLGPWIYKTRGAIGRAIAGVRETFLQGPFNWYGRMFLRLTHGVSRQQEFVADQVAARVAGGPALGSALRRITALAPIFSAYVSQDVLPVVQAGFLPPIASGFDEYLRADRIVTNSQKLIEEAVIDERTDPFDTHPNLRDRLACLGLSNDAFTTSDADEGARTLVASIEKQGLELAKFSFGTDAVRRLRTIDWASVGDTVYAPTWRAVAKYHAKWLSRHTTESLPLGKRAFIALGSDLVAHGEMNMDSDARIGRAISVIGVAISVLLLDRGWRIQKTPGKPPLLARGSTTFSAFDAARELAEELTTADAWRSQCRSLEIDGQPLHG